MSEPLKTDPEVIYLEPAPGSPDTGRMWCEDDVWTGEVDYEGTQPVKYLRADIAASKHIYGDRDVRVTEGWAVVSDGRLLAWSDLYAGLSDRRTAILSTRNNARVEAKRFNKPPGVKAVVRKVRVTVEVLPK